MSREIRKGTSNTTLFLASAEFHVTGHQITIPVSRVMRFNLIVPDSNLFRHGII